MTASLLLAAWGGLAAGKNHDFFERRGGDIDADLAGLLEADPILIVVNEVTGARAARLNSITGGDVMSARRPHGKTISRSLTGMVLCTSVQPPHVPSGQGLARRVIVFHFPRRYPDAGRDHAFSQDELDAAVTLPLLAARAVGRDGWTPPVGNSVALSAFLEGADPVTAWLDTLPDDYAGKAMGDLAEECRRAIGAEKLSGQALGRAANDHPRWLTHRANNHDVMRLRRRGAALL